jgi:hypothetical protein
MTNISLANMHSIFLHQEAGGKKKMKPASEISLFDDDTVIIQFRVDKAVTFSNLWLSNVVLWS